MRKNQQKGKNREQEDEKEKEQEKEKKKNGEGEKGRLEDEKARQTDRRIIAGKTEEERMKKKYYE